MSGDDKAKDGRGRKKTGQNAHTPTPIPQHVLDRAWRTTEEALFNPPWPPRYRRQLERLNREADARKTSPSKKTSTTPPPPAKYRKKDKGEDRS